jgi:hypothetical protein
MERHFLEQPHSLGKGEVDSSILSGSTTKAHETRAFPDAQNSISAVAGRTRRERDISGRGKSVDSVQRPFAEPSLPSMSKKRAVEIQRNINGPPSRRATFTA